jgi:hypothetical protein
MISRLLLVRGCVTRRLPLRIGHRLQPGPQRVVLGAIARTLIPGDLGVFSRLDVLGAIVHFEQLLFVEDHLVARMTDHVVFVGQFDRVHRTGFLAHPAIDATQLVNVEERRILLAILPRRFVGHDVNAVRRTRRLAHETRHAGHPPVGIAIEPMHPAVILGVHLPLLLGILHGDPRLEDHVVERDLDPLRDLREIQAVSRGYLRRLHLDNVFVANHPPAPNASRATGGRLCSRPLTGSFARLITHKATPTTSRLPVSVNSKL